MGLERKQNVLTIVQIYNLHATNRSHCYDHRCINPDAVSGIVDRPRTSTAMQDKNPCIEFHFGFNPFGKDFSFAYSLLNNKQ